MNLQEIEAVARALYEIQEEGWSWAREPEQLKDKFREEARAAIAVLDGHSSKAPNSRSVQPLSTGADGSARQALFVTAVKRVMH
jgi:hypothetical protein